ncbi:MAG: glycosyl hydrolase, partial [Woeseiaceae bacterium]|nr:glycosyl hydrolase [Woeseiaceae bacterium]
MNFSVFLRYLPVVVTLCATAAQAGFGNYEGHEIRGQSLIVTSNLGNLHVTALNDSSFEAHYIEKGVKQLPSFATDGTSAPVATVVIDRPDAVVMTIGGLTAVVNKNPVRIAYFKSGELLLAEEHGYFAYETLRGFRFSLDNDEKILGGGQRVLGMDRRGQRMPLYNKAHYGYTTESNQMYYG